MVIRTRQEPAPSQVTASGAATAVGITARSCSPRRGSAAQKPSSTSCEPDRARGSGEAAVLSAGRTGTHQNASVSGRAFPVSPATARLSTRATPNVANT
jgi:hypothetical protein